MLLHDALTNSVPVFDFEQVLDDHGGGRMKPKKSMNVCQNFQSGQCENGDTCQDRHIVSHLRHAQLEVCRYWLRGTCANGPDCLYMHDYQERFVPECTYFTRFGECINPDCNFRHVSPLDKIPECAAYSRGFCPKGPSCTLRHLRKECCADYMAGFCPAGDACPKGHPVQRLYDKASTFQRLRRKMLVEQKENNRFKPHLTCFKCLDPGHVPKDCPGVQYGILFKEMQRKQEPGEKQPFTPDGRAVGCFLCSEEGHTVKDCPEKGGPVHHIMFQTSSSDLQPHSQYGGGGGGVQQHQHQSYHGGGGKRPRQYDS